MGIISARMVRLSNARFRQPRPIASTPLVRAKVSAFPQSAKFFSRAPSPIATPLEEGAKIAQTDAFTIFRAPNLHFLADYLVFIQIYHNFGSDYFRRSSDILVSRSPIGAVSRVGRE